MRKIFVADDPSSDNFCFRSTPPTAMLGNGRSGASGLIVEHYYAGGDVPVLAPATDDLVLGSVQPPYELGDAMREELHVVLLHGSSARD